jgi:hypothetical protein
MDREEHCGGLMFRRDQRRWRCHLVGVVVGGQLAAARARRSADRYRVAVRVARRVRTTHRPAPSVFLGLSLGLIHVRTDRAVTVRDACSSVGMDTDASVAHLSMGSVGKIKTRSNVLPLDMPMFIAGSPWVLLVLFHRKTIGWNFSTYVHRRAPRRRRRRGTSVPGL